MYDTEDEVSGHSVRQPQGAVALELVHLCWQAGLGQLGWA